METKFYGNASSQLARKIYDHIDLSTEGESFVLGEYNSADMLNDPKRLGFLFSRYKFVSKILEGFDSVLEIGCQEGLGTPIVAQSVGKVMATDFFIAHIESAKQRLHKKYSNIEFIGHDIISGPLSSQYDGAYSLDVLEHIDPSQEDLYLKHVCSSLKDNGTMIIGMPSLESQEYASPASKQGHINCKRGNELKELCHNYFHNVFMFGMNDEVVHTGFLPMCHYLFALCVSPKRC